MCGVCVCGGGAGQGAVCVCLHLHLRGIGVPCGHKMLTTALFVPGGQAESQASQKPAGPVRDTSRVHECAVYGAEQGFSNPQPRSSAIAHERMDTPIVDDELYSSVDDNGVKGAQPEQEMSRAASMSPNLYSSVANPNGAFQTTAQPTGAGTYQEAVSYTDADGAGPTYDVLGAADADGTSGPVYDVLENVQQLVVSTSPC